MAQVKKLSVATVWGAIDLKAVLNATAPIHVMTVYGTAVGIKTGQSNYGDWTALVGQFEAINPATGEVSEAAQLFLPEVALIPIRVAMENQGARSVQFAIKLFVKQSTNAKPGGSPYEYSFEHVLPPAEDDPMAKLRSAVKSLALPAPVGQGDKPAADAGADKAKAKGK